MTGDQQPLNSSAKNSFQLDRDFALQAARLGLWQLDPRTNLFHWDDQCRQLMGIADLLPMDFQQASQYIYSQDVNQVIQVIQLALSAQSGGRVDVIFRTVKADESPQRWLRFSGQATREDATQVTHFGGVLQEVTDQVLTRQGDTRFKYMADNARDAFILMREDGSFAYLNELALKRWGYTQEEAEYIRVPDVDPIYTDEVFRATFAQAQLEPIPPFETIHRQKDGTLYPVEVSMGGIMLDGQPHMFAVARAITERKEAQLALAQSEAALRQAIELAELGTYTIDVATNHLIKSPRVADWYGLPEVTDVEVSLGNIDESDRQRIRQILADVLKSGSTGYFNEEYTIFNPRTTRKRILHTSGQVERDSLGQAVRINGIVVDVTTQRQTQLVLEQQVQQRTDELAEANKELTTVNQTLAANNEEYAAINEELTASGEDVEQANRSLEEANLHLSRSNQNLEQFAYIASHDLQEPLRKIQSFGDLLKTRYASSTGEELIYLERMQSAASRMSQLIRDLLAFSRISTSQVIARPVPLAQVVRQALDDLSVVVGETKAQVEINQLPTVRGDISQLGQLFFNLLANALKFSRRDQRGNPTIPQISIHGTNWLAADLPASVKPVRPAAMYHRIDVIDNGVGFDEKYLDRIFQVFQRLHGKSEFAGTGIGLAIVQKVIDNHGGAITATSTPGRGATFSVYIPV